MNVESCSQVKRFFTCKQLIQRQQRKSFLHRIGDEKWIFYDNPKKKKYYAKSIVAIDLNINTTAEHSSFEDYVLVGSKKSLVYYELLKPVDSIMGDRYRLQLIRLNRARKTAGIRAKRHDKVILLHDNARPHVAEVVKKYLETLKWDVLSPYSPDIAPSDYWLFQRMQHDLASH